MSFRLNSRLGCLLASGLVAVVAVGALAEYRYFKRESARHACLSLQIGQDSQDAERFLKARGFDVETGRGTTDMVGSQFGVSCCVHTQGGRVISRVFCQSKACVNCIRGEDG